MSERRATAVTRHIADQVRQLRREQGVSAARLATAMQAYGGNWTRTTVATLECGLRQSVTVEDLFALAAALDVPIGRLLPAEATGPTPDEVLARMVRELTDLRRELRSRP